MAKYVLFMPVLLFFIVGCAEKTDPFTSKNPYTSFTVSYDVVTNKTSAKVFLWQDSKNGKLLIIDKDEQLSLNDRSMQYQSTDGSYLVILESFFPPYTFKLVDLKKNTFVNTITEDRISFPVNAQYNGDSINTSFPVILKWSGLPVDTNESVTLSVGDKKFVQDTLTATSIIIPVSDMVTFKGKTILVNLERYKECKLQQKPGSDGTISLLYKAQPKELFFKEGPVPLTDKNVYAEFSVIHDAATNISIGTAQFWDGGKSGANLFVDAFSILQFQSKAMPRETGTNQYSTTIFGFLSEYQFRFVDINKKEFINSIMGNRISFPVVLQNNGDTVNSDVPLLISWSEAGVDSSEKVTVRISTKSFVQDTLGKKSIIIPTSEIAAFKGTTQQLFIERLKTISLQQKLGTNGFISSKYIAQPKTVYFK